MRVAEHASRALAAILVLTTVGTTQDREEPGRVDVDLVLRDWTTEAPIVGATVRAWVRGTPTMLYSDSAGVARALGAPAYTPSLGAGRLGVPGVLRDGEVLVVDIMPPAPRPPETHVLVARAAPGQQSGRRKSYGVWLGRPLSARGRATEARAACDNEGATQERLRIVSVKELPCAQGPTLSCIKVDCGIPLGKSKGRNGEKKVETYKVSIAGELSGEAEGKLLGFGLKAQASVSGGGGATFEITSEVSMDWAHSEGPFNKCKSGEICWRRVVTEIAVEVLQRRCVVVGGTVAGSTISHYWSEWRPTGRTEVRRITSGTCQSSDLKPDKDCCAVRKDGADK